MNLRLARLRRAALICIACASSAILTAPAHAGTFTLRWSAPTKNVDGSPLTDLQGYYIYVGDTPERMVPLYYKGVLMPSIVLTTSVVRYYAVSAVNVDGIESARTGPLKAPL